MDDRTDFERRLGTALREVAGPVQPVDGRRIASMAAAARTGRAMTRRGWALPRWLGAAAAVGIVAVAIGGLMLTPLGASLPGTSASHDPGASLRPLGSPETGAPWILFEGGHGGGTLYIARADGSDIRVVATGDDVASAFWSPDGTHVGYGGWLGSWTTVDILDGSIRRVPAASQECGPPAWSPDGVQIAAFDDPCASLVRDTGPYVALVMERVDGTGTTRLARTARTPFPEIPEAGIPTERQLAWSPDGTRIAFPCRDDQQRAVLGLCVAQVDDAAIASGTFAPVRLETGDVVPTDWVWTQPAWSPDGRSLVAAARSTTGGRIEGTPGMLVVVPVAGGTPILLATGDTRTVPGRPHAPVWTPDGRSILYYTYLDAHRPHGASWAIGADGQGARQLPIPVGHVCPMALSPDGGQVLALDLYADGPLFIATPDGQLPHTYVTAGTSDDGSGNACPAWQPVPAPVGDALPIASPAPAFSDRDPDPERPVGL